MINDFTSIVILKTFLIVGMDNEIDYTECELNAPKFTYIHKVFFGLSLSIKYLCKYFFGIKQLKITLPRCEFRSAARDGPSGHGWPYSGD